MPAQHSKHVCLSGILRFEHVGSPPTTSKFLDMDIVVVEGESEVCCEEAARGMLMRCGELMALSVALRARDGSRRGGRGAEGGTVC